MKTRRKIHNSVVCNNSQCGDVLEIQIKQSFKLPLQTIIDEPNSPNQAAMTFIHQTHTDICRELKSKIKKCIASGTPKRERLSIYNLLLEYKTTTTNLLNKMLKDHPDNQIVQGAFKDLSNIFIELLNGLKMYLDVNTTDLMLSYNLKMDEIWYEASGQQIQIVGSRDCDFIINYMNLLGYLESNPDELDSVIKFLTRTHNLILNGFELDTFCCDNSDATSDLQSLIDDICSSMDIISHEYKNDQFNWIYFPICQLTAHFHHKSNDLMQRIETVKIGPLNHLESTPLKIVKLDRVEKCGQCEGQYSIPLVSHCLPKK